MLLDHIIMTSVDLTSRLTVYKPTPCNKTTVKLKAGQLVVQQFKILQLWQFCETIHENQRPL